MNIVLFILMGIAVVLIIIIEGKLPSCRRRWAQEEAEEAQWKADHVWKDRVYQAVITLQTTMAFSKQAFSIDQAWKEFGTILRERKPNLSDEEVKKEYIPWLAAAANFM